MKKYKESWVISHQSSANAAATKSRAADTAGYHRGVAYSYTLANTTSDASNKVVVKILDGSTQKWAEQVHAGGNSTVVGGMRLVNGIRGTTNTAMTIKTSGAPGADAFLTVNLEGETYSDPGAD